jgi:hypothetical protein
MEPYPELSDSFLTEFYEGQSDPFAPRDFFTTLV